MIDLNLDYPCVVTVGCFHGKGKPKGCLAEFLRDFVQEFKVLQEEGLHYRSNRISISIKNIIADAPARAFLIGSKICNFSYGCHKCATKAVSMERRMVYLPVKNLPSRGAVDDDTTG